MSFPMWLCTLSDNEEMKYWQAVTLVNNGDLDNALSNYRKALSTLKTALEHVDKSLQMEPSRDVEEGRKHYLEYMEWCRSGIREVELKMRSGGVKRSRSKKKWITATGRQIPVSRKRG